MDSIASILDLDVKNKTVFVRVDFNVPLDSTGAITDDTRIVSSLETIKYLLKKEAKVILASHLGRPKEKSSKLSLAPCAKRLSQLLQIPVVMAPDCIGQEVQAICKNMQPGQCVLLENLRFYAAEEAPESDPQFAKQLAALADVYVNDAFGSAHREHSSTATMAQYFTQKAAGFLLLKEIEFLGNALKDPIRPFFAIIGGAKISTKLGILAALVKKVDVLMLGGAMSYTFLKAQGIPIGNSLVENEMIEQAKQIIALCKEHNVELFLPRDIVGATHFDNDAEYQVFDMPGGIADGFEGMDIGPKTLLDWSGQIKRAKTILWNGPVGAFELKNFSKGTFNLARAIGSLPDTITVIGGGDSVAAVQEAKIADRITHISTGGGASLEYVEQGTLPGIEALRMKHL